MATQQKKLYRSQANRMLSGVCGGIGEFLDLDPALIRVLWVFLTLFGGAGIVLYIVCYFIMPLNPQQIPAPGASAPTSSNVIRVVGILLIAAGAFLLMDNMEIVSFHRLWRISGEYLLPGLLILAGIFVLTRRPNKPAEGESSATSSGPPETPGSFSEAQGSRRLERSLIDRKVLGVCGGLGKYFDIDPTIVRVLFVIFALMSFGFGLALYFILFIIMPEERPRTI